MKKLDIQDHEAKTPNYFNLKRPSPSHITVKLSKSVINYLKEATKKTVTYKGTSLGYEHISQQQLYRPGESGMTYSKY